MSDQVDQLRKFVDEILRRDGLDLESVKRAAAPKPALEGMELPPGGGPRSEGAGLEAIISVHRPVFAIDHDKVDPTLTSNLVDVEASEMMKLVKDNADRLNEIIPSIGRIDLPGDEDYPWAGTGWIVDSELGSDIVVTNAHVAQLFAERSQRGYDFKKLPFLERPETPILDFRREIGNAPSRRFNILEVIHIGTPGLLDVAFLRVAKDGEAQVAGERVLTRPIKLAAADPAAGLAVATIGYPGTDRGPYDLATLLRVFGNVFNTKRCSPGKIIGLDSRGISHDCSSMPGSSGSAVIDLANGDVVGLHFQGVPFQSNHAVPVSAIRRLIQDKPWQTANRISVSTEKPASVTPAVGGTASDLQANSPSGGVAMKTTIGMSALTDGNGVRIVVPLEITVRIGEAQPAGGQAGPASLLASPGLVSLEAAEAAVKQHVMTHPNVVGVRATYLFGENGQITDRKGIVIKVRPEASRNPKDYGLEAQMGGVPVSIEMADLESLAHNLAPGTLEAPAQMQAYERDLSNPRFNLDPVTDDMTLILHVSPEAGWRVLSKFFDGNDFSAITIGMYNFTAPHIIEAVRAAAKPEGRKTILTLDRKSDDIGGSGNKKDDWPEEKVMAALKRDDGERFQWTPASVSGPGRLFATSYHIKVAVLDKKRFWLSSGNWASSNQAPFDDTDHPLDELTWSDVKTYDRDWHAVVVNEKLATTFRNHLKQDFEDCKAVAGQEAAAAPPPDLIVPEDYFLEAARSVKAFKAFAPKTITRRLTVQPVLTPDNYPEVVLPFIKSAKKSVLFINQSFDIKEDEDQIPEHYRGLLDALLDRQQKIDDVRIIFRSGYGKERDVVRLAVEFGFDKDRIKFYGTCHTKGIVVDGKRVLLGSQNWTGAGTKPNRDASLLIDDEEAAQYFTEIFEFDWNNIATNKVPADHGASRGASTRASDQEAVVPSGFRIVPWGAWSGS